MDEQQSINEKVDNKNNKFLPTESLNMYSKLLPSLFSFFITISMILLLMFISDKDQNSSSTKIVISFIGGMFGYTTVELLRRAYND